MSHRPIAAAVALALAATLASCATPTPYRAGVPAKEVAGYSEIRLETDRWRVVFLGNSLTSRATVETYLLYRAAELTRAEGYDWFIAVARDTEAHRNLWARPGSTTAIDQWSPRWRIADRAGWRAWDPSLDDGPIELSAVTAYEAIAEIRVGRGARPDDPNAFDARSVLSTLQPRIVRPE